MDYSNSIVFGENEVSIKVEDNEIEFTVNGQYDAKNVNNKVAITKWLLKEWNMLKNKYEYLIACPHVDGFVDRSSIYKKLGFTKINGALLVEHIWLNPSLSQKETEDILDNIIQDIDDNEDDRVISWEDFLTSQ